MRGSYYTTLTYPLYSKSKPTLKSWNPAILNTVHGTEQLHTVDLIINMYYSSSCKIFHRLSSHGPSIMFLKNLETTFFVCLFVLIDIHRIDSGGSEPLPAAANLHSGAGGAVHRPAVGWSPSTRLRHRRQLFLQHAPEPQRPVLHHQVLLSFVLA